jgi:hypothetical protein
MGHLLKHAIVAKAYYTSHPLFYLFPLVEERGRWENDILTLCLFFPSCLPFFFPVLARQVESTTPGGVVAVVVEWHHERAGGGSVVGLV